MKRWQRILLEIFGPPGLAGSIILVAVACIAIWEHWQLTGEIRLPMDNAGAWILSVMVGAYILAGIPSLIYAGVMEWRFARGLRPGSGAAIAWSTGLGGICGAGVIGALFRGAGDGWVMPAFAIIGLIVGAIVGLIVRWNKRAGS